MVATTTRHLRRPVLAGVFAVLLALVAVGFPAIAGAAPFDCTDRLPNDFTPCCVESGNLAGCDEEMGDGILGNLPVVGNLPGVGGVL
jgi:hypothetical protein